MLIIVSMPKDKTILPWQDASSGKKPASCSTLDGYEFVWDDSVVTYFIYAICDGSQTGSPIVSYTISDNYELTTTVNDFMFKTLSKGTDLSTDYIITLKQKNLNKYLYIKISKSGEIVISEQPF